ncbi:MAG: hypothetical protein QM500_10495 [Methylococcales bacterium]
MNLQKLLLTLTAVVIFSGCAVYKIQQTEPLDISARWVILPLLNHSDTPEAGARASDIVATLLRSQGIQQLTSYVAIATNNNSLPELNQQKSLTQAISNTRSQGYRFGVGGSVQEWRYKSGLDGEPAAGITLTVTDLESGKVVWSASGSRTGWGRESVSGVAHKLMAKLIDGLSLTE